MSRLELKVSRVLLVPFWSFMGSGWAGADLCMAEEAGLGRDTGKGWMVVLSEEPEVCGSRCFTRREH